MTATLDRLGLPRRDQRDPDHTMINLGYVALTVVQLPPYAPELNATEGVWAHVKRDLGNLLAGTLDQLAASAKRLLKRIQYRPELIDGFRAQTGLALDPQPP